MPFSNIKVKHKYYSGHFDACRDEPHSHGMKHLRRIRKDRGLTQEQLSEKAGVSQGMVSRIEAGTANPTLDIIEALAEALDVSPPMLFGMSEFQSEALTALSQMNPDLQASALILLRKLAAD